MGKILKKSIITATITTLLLTVLSMNGVVSRAYSKNTAGNCNIFKSITNLPVQEMNSIETNLSNAREAVISSVYNPINIIVNFTKKGIYKTNKEIESERLAEEIEKKRAEIQADKEKQSELALYTTSNTYSTPTEYYTTDGLNKISGVNYYGEQKETYYNLDMNKVINNAQSSGVEGEYWVREDGVKMYGPYVIVAANQDIHPYGSTVETSLGEGIVIDSCEAANTNSTQVDIATEW